MRAWTGCQATLQTRLDEIKVEHSRRSVLGAVFVAAATWGHAPDISPCLGASFLVDAANLLPAACPFLDRV